jgi:hypothetical protein
MERLAVWLWRGGSSVDENNHDEIICCNIQVTRSDGTVFHIGNCTLSDIEAGILRVLESNYINN